MKTIATALAAMLAAALGASTYAQETTIEVPQGSGVFPTVGQVNCLEELGSGSLCAATYECSGESGRLWGDLANHDGRRAIGEDSPVARGRDCTITVDGSAAVRWLTGYSPGGRNGELVGLTTSAAALRPVQRVQRQGTEGGGSLLAYILERYDTTLAEYVDEQCSFIRPEHEEHAECVAHRLEMVVNRTIGYPENALTRCIVELLEPEPCPEQGCDLAWPDWQEFRMGRLRFDVVRQCLPHAQEILGDHGLEYRLDDSGRYYEMHFRE